MIIAQYYQFLRLGWEGYRRIMVNLTNIASRLRAGVEDTGHPPPLTHSHQALADRPAVTDNHSDVVNDACLVLHCSREMAHARLL